MKIKPVSYLIFLLFLIFLSACSTFQPERSFVQKKIDSLLVSDFFKSSQAAVSVYDLTNKKSIYELNDKILFHPASNQKILTTAAALKFLGLEHKFSTSVFYSGEIKDSVCLGNIYIEGGFDPEFSVQDLDSLTKEIRKYGIKEIMGNLYGDVSAMDSLFWGSGWMWDDDPGSYIPYLSPLTINKNCITVFYQPGELGNPAEIFLKPVNNFIPIINKSITTENYKSTINVTRDWLNRKNTIFINGNLPINAKLDSAKLNLVNPTSYFLNLMKESLSRNKILFNGLIDTLTGESPGKKIFSIERNINLVVRNANKMSDNLNAEMLLLELAHKHYGKHASAEKGKLLVDSLITLIGINPHNYRIVDGSGLSFYDLVSAELIIRILEYLSNQDPENAKVFFNTLPIAGVDGTLSNRFKDSPAKGHIFAKTGTLSGVSNMSGYIETLSGNKLAFSILIQNFVGSAAKAREIQEKICEILYKEL